MSNPTDSHPPLGTAPNTADDRTVAILSYITIIGFIIAIVLYSSKKTVLGGFHLRQVLGLIVTGLVFWVASIVLMFIPILGWLVVLGGWLAFLFMWLMGLIAAVNGQQKPMPILGAKYQQWFAGAFV